MALSDLVVSDPVHLLEVTFRKADGTLTTRYIADFTWTAPINDSLAPGREYVGGLAQPPHIKRSWFDGSNVGGSSATDIGEARILLTPEGEHGSLWEALEGGWTVNGQSIRYLIGDRSWQLESFYVTVLEGDQFRQSDEGDHVIIDFMDSGKAIDGSVFLDRFQGLGWAYRHTPLVVSTIASHAAYDPTTHLLVEVAYSMPPWASWADWMRVARRFRASGGDIAWTIDFHRDGHSGATEDAVRLAVRDGSDVTFEVVCNDLIWKADGRWHWVALYWDGATLTGFHSTRTSGVKSASSVAVGSIISGAGRALEFGDTQNRLATDDWVELAEVRIAVDQAFTDDEIIGRMHRPLTEAEQAGYVSYTRFSEATGSTSADETGNGHTMTLSGGSWRDSFEGAEAMAGKAKPIALGHVHRSGVVWIEEGRTASVHGLAVKAVDRIEEGGVPLVLGWEKQRFLGVYFNAASKLIYLPLRESPAGVPRLGAQYAPLGLTTGQKVVVSGTASNNGTFTVVNGLVETAGVEGFTVSEAVVNENDRDCWIEALSPHASPTTPAVKLHHARGVLEFLNPPQLKLSAKLRGDLGVEVQTKSTSFHFPGYASPIMGRLLTGWAGESAGGRFHDPSVSGSFPTGAAFKRAGHWESGAGSVTVRQLMDQGATTLWARYGLAPAGSWRCFIIELPLGAEDRTLTRIDYFSLKQERAPVPVSAVIIRGRRNFATLQEGEVSETAPAEAKELLTKEWAEKKHENSKVTDVYPRAEPLILTSWLQEEKDIEAEALRRWEIIYLAPTVYRVSSWWHALETSLFDDVWLVTDEKFPALAGGRKLMAIEADARGENGTVLLWG